MALIKKIDVDEYFAARRAVRLGRLGMVSRPGVAGIKSAAKKKSVLAYAEVLTSEDSPPSVSSPSTPIISDSGRNRLLRPPRSRQA